MRLNRLVRAAVITCIYVVICLLTSNLSFGPIQLRLSESLALLVVFSPDAIIGVTVGCLISNMLASAPIDMVVGTFATLIAALLSYRLRNIRFKKLSLVASIPPVVVNAIIVGIELSYLYYPKELAVRMIPLNILTVGLGQFICCSVVGVLLVYLIERNPVALRLMIRHEDNR